MSSRVEEKAGHNKDGKGLIHTLVLELASAARLVLKLLA